jgi:C-terminal processing protease CtpA/Prc
MMCRTLSRIYLFLSGIMQKTSTKTYHSGSATKPGYLSPKNNILAGEPIVVLTNRRCFSSCNDFVLYMPELPNVVITGGQTGGGGGPPFDYELPNGRVLKYSASMAVSVAAANIENGITPDYFISNSLDDERKGRDTIFKFALEHLQLSILNSYITS